MPQKLISFKKQKQVFLLRIDIVFAHGNFKMPKTHKKLLIYDQCAGPLTTPTFRSFRASLGLTYDYEDSYLVSFLSVSLSGFFCYYLAFHQEVITSEKLPLYPETTVITSKTGYLTLNSIYVYICSIFLDEHTEQSHM